MTYYPITEYYIAEYRCDDNDPDEYIDNLGICAFAEWDKDAQKLVDSWK
jgi:hypothetical protein